MDKNAVPLYRVYMSNHGIVIVGAGQSGYQLAVSLRSAGYSGRVRLVGDEPCMPYQRPPLSKAFLAGTCDTSQITFQDADFYRKHGIEFVADRAIVSLDRLTRTALMVDGERLEYEHLVLAVGARVRTLPFHTGKVSGLHYLRTLSDAQQLRLALERSRNVVVVGAGFLGLEFAAVAAAQGKRVSVVESSQQIMSHAVSSIVSKAFREHHESNGIRFLLGDSVADIQTQGEQITGLRTASGAHLDADAVIVCIGVIPNVELAAKAGLPIANGIVVDASLRTEDPAISALGDCASFPTRYASGSCRLESIQNATDQARHLAQRLASGNESGFDALPWFWSDQGGMKLQIAGISRDVDRTVLRGDTGSQRFSVFGFRDDRLVAVESVGAPGDHMIARRLLSTGAQVSPSMVIDPDVSLRAL
jgi:3-phenylpropionate/trans-cinnamate dioxygenase ferredoxin reductase component